VIALFAVIALLALLDRFGQGTSESATVGPAASLRVLAPGTVRGGLLFQSRIEIRALRDVKAPACGAGSRLAGGHADQLDRAGGHERVEPVRPRAAQLRRACGRRPAADLPMEPFDLILVVVIGDFVQQAVAQSDYSLTGATIVIVTLGLLSVFTAWLSYRFKRLRPVLEGEPIVIIADGRLIERNLHAQRMTAEEVAAEARLQQIGSFDDIRWAVLESNGRMSFLTRE
jgi:hypothetical protein